MIAGADGPDDQVARWAYGVRSAAGPLPIALFRRPATRRAPPAGPLPGSPRARPTASSWRCWTAALEPPADVAEVTDVDCRASPGGRRMSNRPPAARRAPGYAGAPARRPRSAATAAPCPISAEPPATRVCGRCSLGELHRRLGRRRTGAGRAVSARRPRRCRSARCRAWPSAASACRETEAVNRHVTELLVPADCEGSGPESLVNLLMHARAARARSTRSSCAPRTSSASATGPRSAPAVRRAPPRRHSGRRPPPLAPRRRLPASTPPQAAPVVHRRLRGLRARRAGPIPVRAWAPSARTPRPRCSG